MQEPMASIELEKVSNYCFVPRQKAQIEKPLYFIVGSCSSHETVTRFYQFPKIGKEKFSVKTQGSQEVDYIIAPNGHAMIIWQ